MTLTEVVYVVAGIALPAYYLPQILRCAGDNTLLASYSMSKAATQWVLRAAMLPFVFGVANVTMTWVVSLDFLGRTIEFGVAVWSLHAQGLGARRIVGRCLPVQWARRPVGRLLSHTDAKGCSDRAGPQGEQVAGAIADVAHPPRQRWVLHPLVDVCSGPDGQDAATAHPAQASSVDDQGLAAEHEASHDCQVPMRTLPVATVDVLARS